PADDLAVRVVDGVATHGAKYLAAGVAGDQAGVVDRLAGGVDQHLLDLAQRLAVGAHGHAILDGADDLAVGVDELAVDHGADDVAVGVADHFAALRNDLAVGVEQLAVDQLAAAGLRAGHVDRTALAVEGPALLNLAQLPAIDADGLAV